MYNVKDIQFVGKHDYDKQQAEKYASWGATFSVGIFQWQLKADKKSMKPTKAVVRIKGTDGTRDKVFEMAEEIVKLLDEGKWDGRKTVTVK